MAKCPKCAGALKFQESDFMEGKRVCCTNYPTCKWSAEVYDDEPVDLTTSKGKWWLEYTRRVEAVIGDMPEYPSEVSDG